MTSRPNTMLRFALLADALASGATGLLMTAGAGPLSALLQLPEPLLRWAGLALLPFALLVWLAGRSPNPSRGAVLAIVLVNALWLLDSFGVLASGYVAPNALGVAFVAAQAVAVGALAAAQVIGLRIASRAAVVLA